MRFQKFSFSNYKCFIKETTFDVPKLVNLIIGRNNSGKTTLVDFFDGVFSSNNANSINPGNALVYCGFDDGDEQSIYPRQQNKYIVLDPNNSHIEAKQLEKSSFCYNVIFERNVRYQINLKETKLNNKELEGVSLSVTNADSLIHHSNPPINISRLAPERTIKAESLSHRQLNKNGDGLTSIIANELIAKRGNRQLIQRILDDINYILAGEEHFQNILALQNDNSNEFVINFVENNKEIPISDMGSGIKTILMVVYMLNNALESKEKQGFIFEELENNLHPEIQRRLFELIYDFSIKNRMPVFVTSHSHVAINCFYGKQDSLIYHVRKEISDGSTIEVVDSHLSKIQILDDLGVKASDIFQSNGIIWVEGPSDRIYINKWLKIVAPELEEYKDFTYLYYGGKLLYHYSANEEKDVINILVTNRHSAIIIDSDIKTSDGKINDTKRRIKKEFEDNGLFCWITEGREIENYIYADSVRKRFNNNNYK